MPFDISETLVIGDVTRIVKIGQTNCLDWSIAVALNYNIQLTQVPGLEETEAIIIPYNIESIGKRNATKIPDHFGVVIVDKEKKPLYYIIYDGAYLSEEQINKIKNNTEQDRINFYSKIWHLNPESEKERIRFALASFSRMRNNFFRMRGNLEMMETSNKNQK